MQQGELEAEGWPKGDSYSSKLDWGEPNERARRLRRCEAELEENRVELGKIVAQIDTAAVGELRVELKVDFEVNGWDVKILACAKDAAPRNGYGGGHAETCAYVEIKPSLGDDYPAVLRQMKTNARGGGLYSWDRGVLVFDQFAAVGATLDQVRAIFRASGFMMLSIADIDAVAG
jgi:hypothetical protein